MNIIWILLSSQTGENTLSGLVTRSSDCRATHRKQKSTLEKHKWGIRHPPVIPITREKCLFIHKEWHTIKVSFTNIPNGCNSCVKNERNTSTRDGETEGGCTHMEEKVAWHELPVMHSFHRMPCTLETCHNWPQSCSANASCSKSDRQRRERVKEEDGEGWERC